MKKGSALIGVLILLSSLIVMGIGLTSAVLSTTIKTQRAYNSISAMSYAEAGIQKALYELSSPGSIYAGTEEPDETLSGGEFEIEVTSCGTNCKQINSIGYVGTKENYKNKKQLRIKIKDTPVITNVSFNYGIQAGGLGVSMSNGSQIIGNVYAEGTIKGLSKRTTVTGDVIMAGATGKIENINVGGKAKAHYLVNSIIGTDAYYQSIDSYTGSHVGGTKYPNSPDPIHQDMPINQSAIDDWEEYAIAGGTYEGNLTVSGTGNTLGPKKINGNLTIEANSSLTIAGTVWVTGNINVNTGSTIQLDANYGSEGGIIIADNPTNKATYGKIVISPNVNILGSGTEGSFTMMISTNTGSTISDPAIFVANNSQSVVFYAASGFLEVNNNAQLRAITGGGLHLSNGATVTYEQGLASAEFTNGPGGSWAVVEWQQIY